jgi:sugar phosphate isomerase/epimerase
VRVFGGPHPDGISKDDIYGHVADGIAAVLPEAAAAGVKLALETHDDFSTSSAVAAVFERVDDPELGCVWDVLHPYRFGETYRATLDVIRDRVVHVHFKNARQVGDGWEPSMPNDGDLPLREIVDALHSLGYKGYLSLEHDDPSEPDRALREYSLKLRELVPRDEG